MTVGDLWPVNLTQACPVVTYFSNIVNSCSAVCLLYKEIKNEQKEKQLERISGLAGG